ncbi:hypothetical protein E2C01_047464 [Portunus trituberculatus]|uniref:Uncharacterized protein n=1 Tax=Portunus trituberculatus TaxID=210409 RepID=A0A5B7G7J1_PORTR|nr:hypothetical protein [Portunus trituberculatus]
MAALVLCVQSLPVISKPVMGANSSSVRVRGPGRTNPQPVRVSSTAPHRQRLEAARDLLRSSPLIDGHSKLVWRLQNSLSSKGSRFNISADLGTHLHRGLVAAQLSVHKLNPRPSSNSHSFSPS